MARPKSKNPKERLSVTINSILNEKLIKLCEDKNVNKSKYIEHLIKKDMEKGG